MNMPIAQNEYLGQFNPTIFFRTYIVLMNMAIVKKPILHLTLPSHT